MVQRISAIVVAAFLCWAPGAHAIQFGAGIGSSYPNAVDTVNTRTNPGGAACSSTTTTKACAEWANDIQGAIAAIEVELGLVPRGTFATVLARLNAAVYSGTAGLSSYVAGDILSATNTTTLGRIADVATGQVLLSGGVGVIPLWGQVGLTTHVTGILPGTNGGTGNGFFGVSGPTTALKTFAFPNQSATVLTSNDLVTVSQGGTGVGTLTGLVLGSGTSAMSAYGGTSCTNQFPRSLSAAGAATCASVANTDLTNSTISGVALGSTLANLTATDGTLTFSGTYTGETARTIGLNLGNTNTWTALQTFSAGLLLGSDDTLAWGDAVGGGTADTFLSRVSAAKLNFGAADSSSPVAQTLTFQGYNNAVATAGPLAIIQGSTGGLTSGTGGELRLQGGLSGAAAGTGGAITFYTAPLAAGTTPALAMAILPSGYVGFNTNTPAFDATTPIHIAVEGGTVGYSELGIGSSTSGTNNAVGALAFYNSNLGVAEKRIALIVGTTRNATNSGELQFYVFNAGSNTEALRIDPSKQVSVINKLAVGGILSMVTNSLIDVRAGDIAQSGANGQKYVLGRKTELTTIGSGLTTKATTITIPADAMVDAIAVYVKTKPGGTATFTVTSTTSGDAWQKGASISTTAGTSDPGTKGSPKNYNSVAAQTITFTFDVPTTDALGEIRVDLEYRTMTPATS